MHPRLASRVLFGCIFLAAIFLIAAAPGVEAAGQTFEVYTTDNGLSSNAVNCALIDTDGRKWFGVQGPALFRQGVCMLDENVWVWPEVKECLSLGLDKEGNVWAGIWGDGPARYAADHFEYPLPYGADATLLPQHIAFDRRDNIWVALIGCSAYCSLLRPQDGWTYRADWVDGVTKMVQALCSAPDGSLWIATPGDVWRTTDGGEHWRKMLDWSGWPMGWYQDIRFGGDGRAWVVAEGGIWTSDNYANWTWLEHPSVPGGQKPKLTSLAVVGNDGLWFGARAPAGAFWYDHQEWTWVEAWFVEPPDMISDIVVDEDSGDVWCTSTGHGVGVLRGWHKGEPPVICLFVELGSEQFTTGAEQTVSVDLVNSEDRTADLYVALELPGGAVCFYPSWSGLAEPFLTGIHIPAEAHIQDCPLFSLTLPDLPAGTYHWFAACTNAGTTNFASNIASCEWQFVK